MICRECHDYVTDHPRSARSELLKLEAIALFRAKHNAYEPIDGELTPLQYIRAIIRQIEEKEAA